jgi:hypothetical protein
MEAFDLKLKRRSPDGMRVLAKPAEAKKPGESKKSSNRYHQPEVEDVDQQPTDPDLFTS